MTPGDSRPDAPPDDESTAGRWASGIFVALILGGVVFGLAFVVPKLKAVWMAKGIRIPGYLTPLIVLSDNLPWVIIAALVAVWLATRRR